VEDKTDLPTLQVEFREKYFVFVFCFLFTVFFEIIVRNARSHEATTHRKRTFTVDQRAVLSRQYARMYVLTILCLRVDFRDCLLTVTARQRLQCLMERSERCILVYLNDPNKSNPVSEM
jgi:hypothetical protein